MNLEITIREIIHQCLRTSFGIHTDSFPLKHTITENAQGIELSLTTDFPAGFLQPVFLPELLHALKHHFPNQVTEVVLKQFIRAHQTQLMGQSLRGVKNTIAIASGKGGVGKSTIAVNLAIRLAKAGAKVGLLDADIYGPSIPLMLGKATPVDVHNERYLPAQAYGIQAMSIGYLTEGEPALIWRGPMLAKSLLQMINITLWDELDYLLIDLPPGTGDIQLSLVQKIPLTGAIVVTTPQQIATLDAEKAIKMFNQTQIDILGIIENMAVHTCSQCGHKDPIFGQGGAELLAQQYQSQLLGQLPLNTQIRDDLDKGCPTALKEDNELSEQFANIAQKLAFAIANKPINYADKFPPIHTE